MSSRFIRFRPVYVLPVVLLLAGCSTSSLVLEEPEDVRSRVIQVLETAASENDTRPSDSLSDRSGALAVSEAALALRQEIDGWMGTPYLWGGEDHKGIDCSAFVQNVFQDALGVQLPRTTAQQRYTGTAVDKDRLSFADLVFFHTPQKTRHVGIYLGDGAFAHASSSRGVMVSNLSESYWRDAYTYS
ncbi:C40 family peptidase, partial [Rhodothermus sp. AH-315-K08]|nr:C40 family peptidase [Rhodothermus sp. AH-315-K08]